MENLNNLPPFYVGQKVVANCNHISGIVKDKIYTVLGVYKSHCGYAINVGIQINLNVYNNTNSICTCGAVFKKPIESYGIHEVSTTRFSPLQDQVFPSLTMSKVLEKESQLISMN